MKLKDLGDFLIFDAFPLAYDAKTKIILTHLLHLERQILPGKLSTIYTSKRLAAQFKLFCQMKNYTNNLEFIYLEHLKFVNIILEKKRTIQLMVCESQEIPYNLMVLIIENNKLSYLYAGNFVDIRAALLQDTFANCIKHGVDKLYVNLKRSEELRKVNLVDQTLNNIEKIIHFHSKMRFIIHIPMCGCESFIDKLSQRFRKRVVVVSNLFTLYERCFGNNEIFSSDPSTAKIFIKEDMQSNDAPTKYQHHDVITLKLTTEEPNCQTEELHLNNFFFHLYYTPEPSPFDLQLLCLFCMPKHIYGIVDTFNSKSKIPEYLRELRNDVKSKRTGKLKSPTKNKLPILVGTVVGGNKEHIEIKSGNQFLSDSDVD